MIFGEIAFQKKHGSPKENIEYALRVVSDPNIVNEYAQDFGYPDCEENQGQIVQKMFTYPKSAFAYYFERFRPERLDDIYLEIRDNLYSYTSASGVNYEVDLVSKRPQLKEHFIKNEEGIMNQRTQLLEKAKLEKRKMLLKDKGFEIIKDKDQFKGNYKVKWYFKNAAQPGSAREYHQLIRLFLRKGLAFSKAIKNIPNRPPR